MTGGLFPSYRRSCRYDDGGVLSRSKFPVDDLWVVHVYALYFYQSDVTC